MALATTSSTRVLAAAATLALALIASACAGSTGTEPAAERELELEVEEFQNTTTAAPATTTETTTPAAPTTTEPPPPTNAPTTNTPTTILAVPATEAPTTTTGEPADPRDAELEAALQAFSNAWAQCAGASPNCDTSMLAEVEAEPQLQSSTDIAVARNLDGKTVSNLESYRTELRWVSYVGDSIAEVKACTEDGLVVTGPSGELLNDDFASTVNIWTFELIDGSWKVTTGRRLQQTDSIEDTLCDF